MHALETTQSTVDIHDDESPQYQRHVLTATITILEVVAKHGDHGTAMEALHAAIRHALLPLPRQRVDHLVDAMVGTGALQRLDHKLFSTDRTSRMRATISKALDASTPAARAA